MARKIYVEVLARFSPEGKITPLSLVFEDGKLYKIERVLEIKRAAALKAGGFGLRYTVKISGAERFIWLDENKWFVEAKE